VNIKTGDLLTGRYDVSSRRSAASSVPTEQGVETKTGQKVQVEKRTLPGYVLVHMELDDRFLARRQEHAGRHGFVGAQKPVALSKARSTASCTSRRSSRAAGDAESRSGRPSR